MAIRPAPAWETILKRNSVERLKHELFPTELSNQWERLADTSYEKLPEEDIVRLQWFGMYHDKPKIGTLHDASQNPQRHSDRRRAAHDRRDFRDATDAIRAN